MNYIYIDEKRISRQHSIPYRIRFELDGTNLKALDLARQNGETIKISEDVLTNLRYYALLAYRANGTVIKNCLSPSRLVFTTNYLQKENSVAVVCSAIAPEGKISQQIHQGLWQNSELLPEILNIHHWSIAQILSQLSLTTKNYLPYLSSGVSLIFTAIVGILIFNFFSLNYLIAIPLIIVNFIVCQKLVEHLLLGKLKNWILDRLLWGFLGTNLQKRRLAFQLMALLI